MRRFIANILKALGLTSNPAGSGKMKFRPIPVDVSDDMNRQRAFVAALVSKHFPGKQLASCKEDFAILQAIVDKQLLTKQQTWELQALGVCFGDALAGYIPGLGWSLVTDEYGTDPTLRFKDTTTQFNALTMISKRVENGSEVDLAHIAHWLVDFIDKQSSEFGSVPKAS
jgi:hypothetical protein